MRLYKNGNQVRRDGRSVFGDTTHPLVAQYQRLGTLFRINEKGISYAYGRMEFGTFSTDRCSSGHCLRLVINLPMQKYLYGLGEVPFSWPGAALRTQVIAARTYAYEKTVRTGQRRYPCDCAVYDSTLDQVYSGDAKRVPSGRYWADWTAAVDDTKGQVILYKGLPIQALYSSSSGGHTENNENVWGGTPLPYLRGVPDAPDDNSANPNHTWRLEMSYSAFQSKLDSSYGVGSVENFNLMKPFGVSGRVTVVKPDNTGGVKIIGSKKTVRTSGWSIRSALGLKDSLFRVQITRDANREATRN
jgi:SpoIID/LytB domain protein